MPKKLEYPLCQPKDFVGQILQINMNNGEKFVGEIVCHCVNFFIVKTWTHNELRTIKTKDAKWSDVHWSEINA